MWPAIIAGLGTIGSSLIGSGNADKSRKSSEQLERERLAEQRRQFDADQAMRNRQYEGDQQFRDAQLRAEAAKRAQDATQLDPLKQQKSRQLNALLRQMLQNRAPVEYDMEAGKFTGGFNDPGAIDFEAIKALFAPDALAAAEAEFKSGTGGGPGGAGTGAFSGMYTPQPPGTGGSWQPGGQRFDGPDTPTPPPSAATPPPDASFDPVTGLPRKKLPPNQAGKGGKNPFGMPFTGGY